MGDSYPHPGYAAFSSTPSTEIGYISVDAAYACLIHLGLKTYGAQGHKKSDRVLRLPPIRQLKADLQRVVWREAVNDVAKVSHERPVLRRLEKLLAA